MQRTPISTAKFQAAGSIEATVTGFDTSSLVVQSLNDQIDKLIEGLDKRENRWNREVSTEQSAVQQAAQKGMIQADEESTQLQQFDLAIELDDLQSIINKSQSDPMLIQAQLKRGINQLLNQLSLQKQDLFTVDQQLKEAEIRLQQLSEKQQQYASQLLRFKEKQQQVDIVHRMLDQNGLTHWCKLKQMFDVDIIKTALPIGQILRLQIVLLKEIENMIQPDKNTHIQEEKKQLLLEINSQSPLIMVALSFDQVVLNIVHQPKDTTFSKQGILFQLQKCFSQMHLNFCSLAQCLNKLNFSQKLFEDWSKEVHQLQLQVKHWQTQKSHLIIEVDKIKRKHKEQSNILAQRQQETQHQLDVESQNLLTMYLRDKEQLMREIKFKYGKAYHDHMILDVKQEFKNICHSQQEQNLQKLENALERIDQINEQIKQSKEKQTRIQSDYIRKVATPQHVKVQFFDKKEYIVQLQSLKIVLLQLENKIQRKQATNVEQALLDIQNQINKIKQQIDLHLKQPQPKGRSDSIDTIKKVIKVAEAATHGRSQSQIPSVCVQLLDLQLPVTNPQELFESSEDPIKCTKKQPSEWNSYQLSFNQNPLKSISNISENKTELSFNTNNQSSMRGSILEAMNSSAKRKQGPAEWTMLIFLQLKPFQKEYDPILHFNEDPARFGYKIYRLDDDFNVYGASDPENIETYTQFIQKLEVQKIQIDACSEKAIRFQKIYEPSIRQICQESVALRHLRVKYYPFVLKGSVGSIKGLGLNEADLTRLQKHLKC